MCVHVHVCVCKTVSSHEYLQLQSWFIPFFSFSKCITLLNSMKPLSSIYLLTGSKCPCVPNVLMLPELPTPHTMPFWTLSGLWVPGHLPPPQLCLLAFLHTSQSCSFLPSGFWTELFRKLANFIMNSWTRTMLLPSEHSIYIFLIE